MDREKRITELAGLLEESATGRRGALALLSGPVACGRTSLLAAVCDAAAARGALVLRAVASDSEQGLPYAVLGQLLQGVALPEEVRDRLGGLVGVPVSGQPPEQAAQGVLRVTHALLALAARQPLVLAVDDIHHADEESLRCLLVLARRAMDVPLALVLTQEEGAPAGTAFAHEVPRLAHLRRFHVGPLSRAGVAALVADRLGPHTGSIADDFHAASGGNPALLRALVEDHQATGRTRRHGYGEAVLGQTRRWGAAAERVVTALAVLGPDACVQAVAGLSGEPDDTVEHLLEAMTAAGLLDGCAFRHETAHGAVLGRLRAEEREERHRAAARVLQRLGSPAETVARHLLAAGHHAEPWAPGLLRTAADRARERGEEALADDCLRLALAAGLAEPERSAVRFQLLQSRWRLGAGSWDQHLPAVVSGARAGHLRTGDGAALVRQLAWLGQLDDVDRVLAGLGADARPGDAGDITVEQLRQWLGWAYPGLGVRRDSRPATVPAARPENDPWLAHTAHLADALARDRTRGLADYARRVLGDLRTGRGTTWAEEAGALSLSVLLAEGQPALVQRWCEESGELSPGSEARGHALALAFHAESSLRLGELTRAADSARAALERLPAGSWGTAIGQPLSTLVLATVRLGRFDEAAAHVARSVPEALFRSRWGLGYLYARGHYHLATDHHRAALADLFACGDLLADWGADTPSAPPWRTGAAEAWLRLGNQSQMKRTLYEQLGRPGVGGHNRALALHVLATAGPAGRGVPLLSEALELFEAAGDRYQQARVLMALSLAHHALDDRRRARMLFRRARHMAVLCEAEPLCRRLLTMPEELRGGVAEPEQAKGATTLTGSEFRVAVLAVRGYTNREIADRLFVTASTVEQHLTRVYRKLGVKGRRELPVDLEWSTSGAESPAHAAA